MRLHIKGFSFETIVGVYEFERKTPQSVIVDAMLDYEYRDGKYLDYAELTEFIKQIFDQESFLLLEEAIAHVKKEVCDKYKSVYDINVSITKPNALKNCTVTVSG